MPDDKTPEEQIEEGFDQFGTGLESAEAEGQPEQTQDAEGQGEPPSSAGSDKGLESEEQQTPPVESHDYGREVHGLKSRLGRAEAELKRYREADEVARRNAAARLSVEEKEALEKWAALDPESSAVANTYIERVVERRVQEALGEVAGTVDARVKQVEVGQTEYRQQALVANVAQALGDDNPRQWVEEYQTPEFNAWLKSQPRMVRDLEHAEDPDPQDIAYVFRQYRSQAGQAEKAQQKQGARKAAALRMSGVAPSRSVEGVLDGGGAEDSVQAGFDRFVREQAANEKQRHALRVG